MKSWFAWSLVLVGACSGSHKSSVDVDAQTDAVIYTGPCMMTFTGLPSGDGSYGCTPMAGWISDNGEGTFSIDPIQFPSSLRFDSSITWLGMPSETTYQRGSIGMSGGAGVATTDAMMTDWSTSQSNANGSGTYALTFTAVGSAMPAGYHDTYVVHGHLEAMLVGPSVVTLSAQF